MRETTAWIIDLGHGLHAAVGSRDLVHLAPDPILFEIPQTPPYCRHVALWEGALVPVLDVASWLLEKPVERSKILVALLRFQQHPGEATRQGAILAAGIPIRVTVSDEQACALPPRPPGWRHVACSCFLHDNQPMPVLDLPFVFSSAARLDDRIQGSNRRSGDNGRHVPTESTGAQACHA